MTTTSSEPTRDRLVRAAAEEFNRLGYQGTNTNKIARAAGFAPATFYRYFADKSAVMGAAAEWIFADRHSELHAAISGVASLADAAHSMLAVLTTHQRRWRPLIASISAVASTQPAMAPVLQECRRRDIELFQQIRARFAGKPAPREQDMVLAIGVEALSGLLASADVSSLDLCSETLTNHMANQIVRHFAAP